MPGQTSDYYTPGLDRVTKRVHHGPTTGWLLWVVAAGASAASAKGSGAAVQCSSGGGGGLDQFSNLKNIMRQYLNRART